MVLDEPPPHPDAESFSGSFSSLQSLLLSMETVDDFLGEVAETASRIVPTPVSCGITVEHDKHPLTVASSDLRARRLDESQYEPDEGPCLHAMRHGEVVDVPDSAVETRWTPYFVQAREIGLRSSLSLPLAVNDESIGAINLYSCDRTHAFDGEVRERAKIFAAQASTALLLALRRAKSEETNRQLEAALTSRSVVDQAMGILMAQQRCTVDEAFGLLRSHSQNNNRKLRDVAQEIVNRTGSEAH